MTATTISLPKGLAIATQSVDFWRRLAPELTISDSLSSSVIVHDEAREDSDRALLTKEGYLHLKQPGLTAPLNKIAEAMTQIVEAGLPPAFIGVYDEVWSIAAQMQGVVSGLFDCEAALVPDFCASFARFGDPVSVAKRTQGGSALFRDGSAKTLSVTVPITKATPDNGCLYLVPADQDRNYGQPETARADASLHGIKAVAADAGDVVILTGETYHWRSRVSPHNQDAPLISLTWQFQSMGASPLGGRLVDSYPYVPFEARLGLLAHQLQHHSPETRLNPVWRLVQQTLANRFPIGARMAHI